MTKPSKNIAPGMWVRDQIRKNHPNLPQKAVPAKGKRLFTSADLNKNGKIEGNEIFYDLDGDGYIGNVGDYILYYKKNRSAIEKNIPFFKWAAGMDRGRKLKVLNPLHDHLSLLTRIRPTKDIRATYAFAGKIMRQFRKKYRFRYRSYPGFVLKKIHQIIRRNGIKYGSTDVVSDMIKQRTLDCDTSALFVMGMAYQLGIKTSFVSVPEHGFLRYKRGKRQFNFDQGGFYSNAYYKKWRNISTESIQNGVYLRSLKPHELLGYFHTMNTYVTDKSKQYKETLSYISHAIQLNPKDACAYVTRGITQYNLGHYKAAIADFTKAIALNPKDASYYVNRGVSKYNLGQHKAAIADYTQAIVLDSKNAQAYYRRGIALKVLARYKAAIVDLSKAIQLDPKNYSAYFYRAVALTKLNRDKAALADLNRTIKLNPKLSQAYHNKGAVLANLGRYKESISSLTRAIQLNPKLHITFVLRAQIYVLMKQSKKAMADLRRAVQIDPKARRALISDVYHKISHARKISRNFKKRLEHSLTPLS